MIREIYTDNCRTSIASLIMGGPGEILAIFYTASYLRGKDVLLLAIIVSRIVVDIYQLAVLHIFTEK